MKISEERLRQIIRETVNDVIEFGDSTPTNPYKNLGGGVGDITKPYTPQEKEQNFKGIGRMGNPSWDAFNEWRKKGLEMGVPSKELSWSKYLEQKK